MNRISVMHVKELYRKWDVMWTKLHGEIKPWICSGKRIFDYFAGHEDAGHGRSGCASPYHGPNNETIVIVITGYATVETAIKAMKLGAYDFIPKPFEIDQLRIVVGRALEKQRLKMKGSFLKKNAKNTGGSDR
jgi:hypothetical protein